jgi:hypothetical protein
MNPKTTTTVAERRALNGVTAEQLRDQLRGELVLPGDAAYDEARRVRNGMIGRRPTPRPQRLSPSERDQTAATGTRS